MKEFYTILTDTMYFKIVLHYIIMFSAPAIIVYIIMKIKHQLFIKKIHRSLWQQEKAREIEEREDYIKRI